MSVAAELSACQLPEPARNPMYFKAVSYPCSASVCFVSVFNAAVSIDVFA